MASKDPFERLRFLDQKGKVYDLKIFLRCGRIFVGPTRGWDKHWIEIDDATEGNVTIAIDDISAIKIMEL